MPCRLERRAALKQRAEIKYCKTDEGHASHDVLLAVALTLFSMVYATGCKKHLQPINMPSIITAPNVSGHEPLREIHK